jgi:adenine deaminase
LTAEDIAGALAANPERVAGLGEMMNFPGVLMGLPPVLAKLEAATGRVIDGHAPLVTGKDLNAYILAGPSSDHESTQLKEGREKLGKGMHLMLRAGTHEKNMPDLLPAVTDANWPQCSFVSDDRHVVDIVDNGHLDATVRQAIGLGMDPVRAVQLASLTTARHYGMHDRGALAPGYRADFFLVEDLRDFRAGDCYLGGRDIRDLDFSSRVRPPTNTMDVKSLDPGMFAIPAHTGEVRVIGIVPGQIVTENLVMAPTISAGQVVADPDRDLAKLAVIERHHGSGAVGLGLVRGLGLQHGALAGTVAHDSHNLIVAGTSDEDMLVAARRAVEMGGGFVLVADGRVVADMPLPIAGLMSDAGVQEAAAQARALTRALPALGSAVAPEPFMILSFLALPVIPSLKLTDKGLVDVGRFDLVDLWVS